MNDYISLIKASKELSVPVERVISLIRNGEMSGVLIEQGNNVADGFVKQDDVNFIKSKK